MRMISRLPLLLACLLVLAACESSVDPILDSDRDFSMYGTLDMDRDRQFVRVVPIRETLDPGAPGALDIAFTSTDLATGRTMAWRDSLIHFSDGSFGHVFNAPLRLQAGHSYRVEIKPGGSDLITSATTEVPEKPEVSIRQAIVAGSWGQGSASGTQSIDWSGIIRKPFRVDLWYRFVLAEGSPFVDIRLPYQPSFVRVGNTQWEARLDLRNDRITLDTLINVQGYMLAGVGMTVTLLDNAFEPPGGVFDREVLAQPGALNNVENGFGFVGSVARFSTEWMFPDDVVDRLGYRRLRSTTAGRRVLLPGIALRPVP